MISPKIKIGIILVALCLYVYAVICVKTAYDKSTKLEEIYNLAITTQNMINQLEDVDRNLQMKIENLQDLLDEEQV